MFTLTKQFRFEASHQLPKHDGKCARLHGHSWVGYVEVQGLRLQSAGPKENMVLDYADLSAAIKPVVEERLDHHHLNETLEMESPTSEAIAVWLWDRLSLNPQLRPFLSAIIIEETCTSRCEYRPASRLKDVQKP